ncbi:MAG: energy transducer TonB [Bacteroidetes bacterium]|jgi:protein TonB|nr:energy transducer TonB [Bacteroidota bacterium]
MSYLLNNQQKINEIIFAKRNKNYGAYAIRSSYGNTLFKSIAFMALGFGTILSIAFYMSNRPQGNEKSLPLFDDDLDSVIVCPYDFKKDDIDKPKDPVEPVKNSGGSQDKGLGTVITDTAMPEPSASTMVTSGPVTNTPSVNDGPLSISDPVSQGNKDLKVIGDPPVDPPTIIPDSLPEFEGGLIALRKFLADHLRYPPPALDGGVTGTLYVKFIVEKTGKVSSPTLLNNLGYGLDEEAMRVVSMIPKFKKPGRVHGLPVRTYFNVPIKFQVK